MSDRKAGPGVYVLLYSSKGCQWRRSFKKSISKLLLGPTVLVICIVTNIVVVLLKAARALCDRVASL